MKWQDTVIAICQIGFLVAFIPTLHSDHKPAVATSMMNAGLIAIITFSLATLKLWFSATTAGLVGMLWVVVGIQKIKIERAKQKMLK